MAEEMNGLRESMSPQILSPHLAVGGLKGLNRLLGIPILSVTLPTTFKEKSTSVFTMPQYCFPVVGVLLSLGGHPSNNLRVS